MDTAMKGYRDNVVKVVMDLFEVAANQVLNAKNDVNFFL